MDLYWQSNVSLLFNMLSRLVTAFLPRSKRLLISWLQSPSSLILEPKKIKSVTVSIVSPSICHEMMGLDAMILVFWMFYFKPAFSLSSFTLIKRLFSLEDAQQSSPTPQFKSINSSALSLLYGPALTSVHDYRTKGNLRQWVSHCGPCSMNTT